ncbi:MAG: 4Fe-4S binding protein [Lachnospiraceae bacterium]
MSLPNGCIGLGTCAKNCPFDAISVVTALLRSMPQMPRMRYLHNRLSKHIIRLIPFDSRWSAACRSTTARPLENMMLAA